MSNNLLRVLKKHKTKIAYKFDIDSYCLSITQPADCSTDRGAGSGLLLTANSDGLL